MTTVRSARLAALPPFLFDEIDRKKRARIAAGADVINLGVGDPDRPTPDFIVEEMNRAMRDLVNQQYPAVGGGLRAFREAVAEFMERRFGVNVDPMRHVVALLGSKDGISHLPWAVTNPGDAVMTPDPAYPVYEAGALLAGCRVVKVPLSHEDGWRPRPERLTAAETTGARILWLNFPSNPTAASADAQFYEGVLEWCQGRGVIAASDLAYSELYFDRKPPSLWQAGNADIESTPAVEFHSLSKTFNMTGWRLGFAVGHEKVVGALQEVKSNVDSGTFNAIQVAGAAALHRFDDPVIGSMRTLYRERRDAAVEGLRAAGCHVDIPAAGFFVWAKCPAGPSNGAMGLPDTQDSMAFCARALDQADVVLVPGAGFGPRGRDWFRVALTVDAGRIREAGRRLKSLVPR
ncbi:MAG: aminotransferase class I/II-fold pyridoxal phosphate-dependent enzyme [Phycisphaerales bacterium]|nr:aminotransferase class I/II-fold pyridoxal phosphate-dependent enzyme [Phycisphaerales bacterium]